MEGEELEGDDFFSPQLGNVVFCSSVDGWGFRIDHFAEIYSQKLGVKKELLQKALWGEFYLNTKNKRIYKKPTGADSQPMFVKLILANIWEVYKSVVIARFVI